MSNVKKVKMSKSDKISIKLELQKIRDGKEVPKKVEKPLKRIPPAILSIIEHWNSLGLKQQNPVVNGKATKYYKRSVKLLKQAIAGKGFKRKYSPNEIKKSFSRFAKSLFDDEYYPPKNSKTYQLYSKINIDVFIGGSATREGFNVQPLFPRFVSEDPIPMKKIIEDPCPELTEIIKSHYETLIMNGHPLNSPEAISAFRNATKQILDILRQNFDDLPDSFVNSTDNEKYLILARTLIDSLKPHKERVNINWLNRRRTWEETYLKQLMNSDVLISDPITREVRSLDSLGGHSYV